MYKDFGKYIIRLPLYEYQILFDKKGDTISLDKIVDHLIYDKKFLESLYWASPGLQENISNLPPETVLRDERLKFTLKKYIIRMSTRCTPYGTFAGCDISYINKTNSIKKCIPERRIELDSGLLSAIIHYLKTHVDRSNLEYEFNDSIYPVGSNYRFIERIGNGFKLDYQISSIERDEFIDSLLTVFRGRKCTLKELCDALGRDYSEEEKQGYLHSLIDSDILIPSVLEIHRTEKPLQYIKDLIELEKISIINGVDHFNTFLEEMLLLEQEISSNDIGEMSFESVRRCKNMLEDLKIPINHRHLFQAHLIHGKGQGNLTSADIHNLNSSLSVLGKLTFDYSNHEKLQENFKKLFKEKYGDTEVPLLEVMDAEYGIGYPANSNLGSSYNNDFLGDIARFPLDVNMNSKNQPREIEIWLQAKVRNAIEKNLHEIRISPSELDNFKSKVDRLSPEIYALGLRIPGNKILLQSIGGTNCLSLLGRFTNFNSEIKNFCREISDSMKSNGKIFAEIIFTPDGRTANISKSSNLFDYQIPILSFNTGTSQNVIKIQDLLVSVKSNKIILFSKVHKSEIVPVLPNAHNYMFSTVPIYRFLASMQHQGKIDLGFNLGEWSNWIRYLPRFSVGNIIIQRATWQFFSEDIQAITSSQDPLGSLMKLLDQIKTPKYICLIEGDNELFIDRENHEYLEILLNEIKNKDRVIIVEWLHGNNIGTSETGHLQQFVIPLRKNVIKEKVKNERSAVQTNLVAFIPGSEWLYLKIYCSSIFSDEILIKTIFPFIHELLGRHVIDKAFFIRYNDPHYHLRVRFHFKSEKTFDCNIQEEIFQHLRKEISHGIIWKLQYDTYVQELDRYGVDWMELSEEVFHQDTLVICEVLKDQEILNDDKKRFYVGLKNIDSWLDSFSLLLEERIEFCSKMSTEFSKEFQKEIKYEIDVKFRKERKEMEESLTNANFISVFAKRQEFVERSTAPIKNLSSYIHMSTNRLFLNNQRLSEFMLYRFLTKFYQQKLKRRNGSQ